MSESLSNKDFTLNQEKIQLFEDTIICKYVVTLVNSAQVIALRVQFEATDSAGAPSPADRYLCCLYDSLLEIRMPN